MQELIAGLDMVGALDAGIGRVKQRDRGVSGGQLLMGMATAQLAGQDCRAGLDRVRADAGSALLTTAPVPPSTTAASIAGRFIPDRVAGIETGRGRVYRWWLAVGAASVRAAPVLRNPTIDLDASDVEVFGRTKRNVGWTYAGVRAGRVHLASWAQAELPLADLLAGDDDVRPAAGQLLQRALAVLPSQVCGRPRVRADAGYFDAALAQAADLLGCDFAVAAKRNSAAWRACAAIPETDWKSARGMPGGQVAACVYAPAGWPAGSYTIVRRVKIDVERLSADPRSRRRRTVAKDQLALALGGAADHVWATSFIVTNIPADSGDYVGLEAWFSQPDQHRGTVPRGQARRRREPPALRRPDGQHRLDVGRAARRRHQRHAPGPDRTRPAHRRTDPHRDPAAPASCRPRTVDPARPRPDAAAATGPPPAAQHRARPAQSPTRHHLTDAAQPPDRGPRRPRPRVGDSGTPTTGTTRNNLTPSSAAQHQLTTRGQSSVGSAHGSRRWPTRRTPAEPARGRQTVHESGRPVPRAGR